MQENRKPQPQNRLKYLRNSRELTLTELAKKTGITRSLINHQENGKRAIPLETAKKYCNFFNCTLDFFYCNNTPADLTTASTAQINKYIEILQEEIKRRNKND